MSENAATECSKAKLPVVDIRALQIMKLASEQVELLRAARDALLPFAVYATPSEDGRNLTARSDRGRPPISAIFRARRVFDELEKALS